MNPFEEFLQRILGRQPTQTPQIPQAPFAPQQPLSLPSQPFSAPTPAPQQQGFLPQSLRTGLAALVAPNPIASALMDGSAQREAWNAFLPDVKDGRLQSSAERVAAMSPEQQLQVFSDVGGMVNPIAALSVGEGPMARNMFSRMQRAIQEAPFPRGTAAQWLSELEKKSARGEREWTGIADVLKADPQRMIHKAELEELADKKGIRIVEDVEGPENSYAGYVQPGESSNYRMISLVLDEPKELKNITAAATEKIQNLKNEINALDNRAYELIDELTNPSAIINDNSPSLYWDELKEIASSKNGLGGYIARHKKYGRDVSFSPEVTKKINEYVESVNKIDELKTELRTVVNNTNTAIMQYGFPGQAQGHGQPTNTLVHIRLTDRDIGGKKVLFVEEIQSDWHQSAQEKVPYTLEGENPLWGPKPARKIGYQGNPKNAEEIQKINRALEDLGYIRGSDDPWSKIDKELEEATDPVKRSQIEAKQGYILDLVTESHKFEDAPVPGPFSNTSEWTELALKKVLQEAVDGGYDQVVIATGQQAVEVMGGKTAGMQSFYDLAGPGGKVGIIPATLKDYAKKLGVKLEMEQSNVLGTRPEQAKELANYRLGQLARRRPDEVIRPEDASAFVDVMDYILSERAPWAIEGAEAEMKKFGIDRETALVRQALYGSGFGLSPEAPMPTNNQINNLVELYGPAIEGALSGNMNAYNNIVFKITPDVKSAVGKGQRLWSAGASIGPAMELLRQRQGLPPKKEEKKKK